eukprot:362779-Chlamydomonas_euryale.AAC.5
MHQKQQLLLWHRQQACKPVCQQKSAVGVKVVAAACSCASPGKLQLSSCFAACQAHDLPCRRPGSHCMEHTSRARGGAGILRVACEAGAVPHACVVLLQLLCLGAPHVQVLGQALVELLGVLAQAAAAGRWLSQRLLGVLPRRGWRLLNLHRQLRGLASRYDR